MTLQMIQEKYIGKRLNLYLIEGSPGPCLGLLAGSDGDNDPFQEASLDDCEATVKSPMGMVLKKTVVT